MSQLRNKKTRRRQTITALAVASVLVFTVSATAVANTAEVHAKESSYVFQVGTSLEGPLFIGPVESLAPDGKTLQILGKSVQLKGLSQPVLPSEYIAVFGSINEFGGIEVGAIKPLGNVYAPGSSLVLYSGKISGSSHGAGVARIGDTIIDGSLIPDFDGWLASQLDGLVVVMGTQSMASAAVRAHLAVSFSGPATLEISGTGLEAIDGTSLYSISNSQGRGIDGSGAQVSARGIDGSGAQISSRGIDGSGAQISSRGIDGSGAQISSRGIDGSGAQISSRGIDGSGAQISSRGIDGSGAQISSRGIDGSGAQVSSRGIDGSGAQISSRGIDGSGAQVSARGIDGSGAKLFSVRIRDNSGTEVFTFPSLGNGS